MKTYDDDTIDDFTHATPRRGFKRLRAAFRTNGLTEFIAEAVREASRRRRERKVMRAQIRLLAELDERTLKDIGLARGEIGSISAELDGHAQPTRRRVRKDSVAPLY